MVQRERRGPGRADHDERDGDRLPAAERRRGVIARGADDALWIAETAADTFARMYVAGPEASFSPTAPAFGTVDVGTSATRTVTLTNTGTLPLSLSAPAVNGDPAFTVDASTCAGVLAAGDACTVTLRFAPLSAGPRSATLSFAGAAHHDADAQERGGDLAIELIASTRRAGC